jgi:myb proto-oncogene protein
MTKQQIFKILKIKIWSQEEDKILLNEVGHRKKHNWNFICLKLNNKTAQDCYNRYKTINNKYYKGKWSSTEDELVLELINKYGRNWSKLSKEMKTRSGKQIRDRYVNMLDEKIDTSKFTIDEDIKILELHEKYGNRWSLFTKFLKNRSADKIKNRFNSSIRNKKKTLNFMNSLNFPEVI